MNLSDYDGTIERASKQVNEIMDAIDSKKLTGHTYIYKNDSGEKGLQGLLYLSSAENNNKDWYLRLNNEYYAIEYFFGADDALFAIRQWKYGEKYEMVAEIFYKDPEGVITGSWLQRTNEERIDLASYTGDFWYDYLEGYPMYSSTKVMRSHKDLQYEQ